MQNQFQPMYLFSDELGTYGLPQGVPDIMNKVMAASSAIDTHCMRADASGYGSLVYSTYTERVQLKSWQPNVFKVTQRPMVGVSATDCVALAASGSAYPGDPDAAGYWNYAKPSTGLRLGSDTDLNAVLSLSGRYGPSRRGQMDVGLSGLIMNPNQLSSLFGGLPNWVAIDPAQVDYNPLSGEIRIPYGILLSQFSEIEITYTAGFDPLNMPRNIKQACANIVKNMLTKPIPGVTSANFSDAALTMQFSATYLDSWTEALLVPYRSVVMV